MNVNFTKNQPVFCVDQDGFVLDMLVESTVKEGNMTKVSLSLDWPRHDVAQEVNTQNGFSKINIESGINNLPQGVFLDEKQALEYAYNRVTSTLVLLAEQIHHHSSEEVVHQTELQRELANFRMQIDNHTDYLAQLDLRLAKYEDRKTLKTA